MAATSGGPRDRRGPAGPAAEGAAAHVFVDDLASPELSPADAHHLGRVLRLRAGAAVTVTDGQGGWRRGRFDGRGVEVDGPVHRVEAPAPAVTVAFSLVKGDRPEWIVQKLTELGVDTIVPLAAERSVVRWTGDRAVRHRERLQRVAREAAVQSRRVRLPRVEPVTDVASVARRPGAVLAEPSGGALDLAHPVVLVGPEGGWSPEESALPIGRVGLGDAVLRGETAAVAAGVLLTALRMGLVAAVSADGPSAPAPPRP